MLPKPRAASPAKSLVDSQSWSMTVKSTQAPRRRHASAGTELQAEGSHLEPCSLLGQVMGRWRQHSQVEEFVVHGVQCPAFDLGPLAVDQREEVWWTQLHDHKGVTQA